MEDVYTISKDMPNSEYHKRPGISKSSLDKIHISPLAYWDSYINPDKPVKEDKHCFVVGEGTHNLILEPEVFSNKYFIGFDKKLHVDTLDTVEDLKNELSRLELPVSGTKLTLISRLLSFDGVYSNRILSTLEDKHNSLNTGKAVLKAEDYHDMLGMLKAVNSHHSAASLIKGCEAENSYFTKDRYGAIRKCRPDIITSDGSAICDLKTTDDVSQTGFSRSIANYRYFVQAAWYLDVLEILMGEDAPKQFKFIAVQKKRPYDVAVHVMTSDQIEFGRREYTKDYHLLLNCIDAGVWPGADGGQVLEAVLPKWLNQTGESDETYTT